MKKEKDIKTEEEAKKPSFISEIFSWIQIIVAAFIIAFLLNNFVIANSTVPTGSMKDTIMEGDRVMGLRLTYTFGSPERGDIAIFDSDGYALTVRLPWERVKPLIPVRTAERLLKMLTISIM